MEITVSIPDNFVPLGELDADVSRQMPEAFAVEEYRLEKISFGLFREVLDLTIEEANGFLKSRRVELNYTADDIERDRKTLELFLKK